MKVFLYHRTAAAEADIEAQVESIWNRATELGYTVEKTYSDPGLSGATLDRPGLKELLADARGGKVKALLACDPRCLASVPQDYDRIKGELEGLGVKIHFIDLGEPKSQLFC